LARANLAAIAEALAVAQSRVIIDFLRYLQRIHPADRLPGRRDIDPLHIPNLLDNVVLAEVHRQPDSHARFFVRVAGEAIVRALPGPVLNHYIGEDIRGNVRQTVLETGKMYYWRGPPRLKFRYDFDDVEYVHCPLADDGILIDRIFSAFHYSGGIKA